MCYHCDKLGHTRSFNIKYLKGINIEKGEENKGVNLAIVVVIDVYIVCDDGSINLTCQDSRWVVDFNALRHVTLLRDVFSYYTSGQFCYMTMGNDVEC